MLGMNGLLINREVPTILRLFELQFTLNHAAFSRTGTHDRAPTEQ